MVHKLQKSLQREDYKEAMSGEGWAIGDYQDMIAKAKTEKEKKVLTEIMNEEKHHLEELMDLIKCGG